MEKITACFALTAVLWGLAVEGNTIGRAVMGQGRGENSREVRRLSLRCAAPLLG